ncbi:MAG: hypothetical protein U0Q18_17945 [Bryobacteraceae bacterium]
MSRVLALLSMALVVTACRQTEENVIRPPKAPGLPIFAGDQLGSNRLLRKTSPEYPAALRGLGRQTVRLKFALLEDGRATDESYISGPEVLLPFARAALARWRYEPVRIYSPYIGKTEAVRVIAEADVRFEP